MTLILSGTDGLSDVDGSAATPAIRGTDANTGIFFGADIIGFAEGGAEVARFNADAQFVAAAGTASLPVITTTGDVNTGIFFPAADTIAFAEGGVEAMRLDSAGNMGLGVTPSAWDSAFKAFQLNTTACISATSNRTFLGQNWYDAASGGKFIGTGYALRYDQLGSNGQHQWYTSTASGTAGNTVSFTQAMTLDASGNLGIGTSSPGAQLQLNKSGTGDFTTFRLSNSGASGKAYEIGVGGNTASAGYANNLYFYDSTASALRMVLDSSGNLLIGTTNTSESAGDGLKLLTGATPGFKVVTPASTFASASLMVYSSGASAYRFYVTDAGVVNATNTTISAISDQRLKENVQDLDVGLDKIMALKPRKFDWKAGKGKDIKGDRGWIAQEFEQVFPDMIDEWRDPSPEGEEPYKSVRADLIPVLVKAMQEQQALITQLQADVAALKGASA